MAFRVEIAQRALADIEAAFLYIRQESHQRASQWLMGIIDAISSLEETPPRCPVAPESKALGEQVRVLRLGRRQHVYRVFFSIQAEAPEQGLVRVFHVRHGAQRPPAAGELEQWMG